MKYIILLLSIFIMTGCKKAEIPMEVVEEVKTERKVTIKDVKTSDGNTYLLITNNSDEVLDISVASTFYNSSNEDFKTRYTTIDGLAPKKTKIYNLKITEYYNKVYIVKEVTKSEITPIYMNVDYQIKNKNKYLELKIKNNEINCAAIFKYNLVLYENFKIEDIISNRVVVFKKEFSLRKIKNTNEINFDYYTLFVE